jgi:hypothetical protein
MLVMLLWGSLCELYGTITCKPLIVLNSLLFGMLYWVLWTIILPYYGRYRLEEKVEVLEDGTSIIKLARIPLVAGRSEFEHFP